MFELMIVGIWGIIILLAVIAGSAIERRDWKKERADLLDRIMARDYEEYATNRRAGTPEPVKVVPLEEIRKIMQEDSGETLGMPV